MVYYYNFFFVIINFQAILLCLVLLE